MILRFKFFWLLIALGMVIGTVVMLIEKFLSGEFSTADWITLIMWPIVAFLGIFVVPTLRITLNGQGISVYWKIGVGPFKLWELRNYHFRWQDVLHIYSLNPKWFPLHMIGIIGLRGGKQQMFFIGSLMTHKKKALLYLADHLGKGVIDQEVKEMIKKYRIQLQNKIQTV